MRFAIDMRLLDRLMTGRAHWNNASVGCHIDFWREPNVFNPDLWTMLSFFHPRAPALVAALSPEADPSTRGLGRAVS